MSALDDFAKLISEALGDIAAQTEMIKLICKHVGVTPEELRAAAAKLAEEHRNG